MTETAAVKPPTIDDLEPLRAKWKGLEGEDLIRAAYDKYGNKLALLSSFGADAAVTLSLVAKVNKNIPVLFLDTHKHFAETLAYVDTMKQHLGLTNIQVIEPDSTLTDTLDFDGTLHEQNPDLCCGIRKVTALEDYVKEHGFVAIMSGRMRGQAAERANMETVEWDVDKNILNLNPIAGWTQKQANAVKANMPQHPLLAKGFHSIGCACCTQPGEGRAGRWTHKEDKNVCGIHRSDSAANPYADTPRRVIWMARATLKNPVNTETSPAR